ncbi:class I SAM-dependent methyltransferase [Pseudomonas sp. FW215-R2]|uniref:class I SAM-dependent methyltransferase n=1 Tax=unclassified Pseudomonas TaxID=196821 RepID=UPI000C88879A|nr:MULTISPECIES: class I SAM-dependent methyltransferase [unclassified Pseudomonas]PMW97075.1 class I SAM-dependent methyltransferase [Pseudomonas sp. FW215-R2]PMX05768.1 class I SAM-dependent methyltransferase [Pseudomonas sp. FW215-L1]PMX18644.1 class I SAM-dependent methyltransferase [Pseudomonas sp. FW215-E1]PNA23302.1 class I SAM-dependent methyltransferase [Pseudomonas sp. FW215-R4]
MNRLDRTRELALARSMPRHLNENGGVGHYLEPPGSGLHHVFFLRLNDQVWVGRKLLQRDRHFRWQASSALKPGMLLGPHLHSLWGDDGLSIGFRTVSAEKKTQIFERALHQADSEILFPFPVLDAAGREAVCSADFWQCSLVLAEQLNTDEQHLREYCAGLLQAITATGALIYDPACSTGEFIAHLARALPDCLCLGTDRSASMIEHARQTHGRTSVEFRLLDASEAFDAGIHCDVLILRFLNAEVLTRREARAAFESLIRCVKPGGTILVFGHTPVLIPVAWLAVTHHLQLESSVAARPGQVELFQFYRLKVLPA